MTMQNDSDAILDDLLCRWHHWQQEARVGRGFNHTALVAGDYRPSRQYDDENGALDAALEERQMCAIDFAVSQMVNPHQAAIYCLARALVVGCMVFTSPRLPVDRQEREVIVRDARAMLTNRLLSAGVL